MHGGLGFGKFFNSEVDRIEQHHQQNLPKTAYTPEEIEAGFNRLASAFGVSGTLFYLQSIPPYYTKAELEAMQLNQVYHWLRYLAWEGDTKKKYSKIMERKMNKPKPKR